MRETKGWSQIELEARGAWRRRGSFPCRAYSEFMPPPQIGIKPFGLWKDPEIASDEHSFAITEYERYQELVPGLERIADPLVCEIEKLVRGDTHAFSSTLLENNPAWPKELDEAAKTGGLAAPVAVAPPLALSRTQDDKGNARWTLFGTSHEGPSAAFWNSFGDGDRARLERLVARAGLG